MRNFGTHYLVELLNCSSQKISSVSEVHRTMLRAAEESGATILSHSFHQFRPGGVSGVVFIAESHLSIHTWPEDRYAAVDVFTCGQLMAPERAVDLLAREFEAEETIIKQAARGF